MTASELGKHLTTDILGRNRFCFETLDSTSTYIRRMWRELPDGHTVIASEQLSGRGRTGRDFYSPKDDGLYFSFLLKDEKYISDPLFTIKMSYAVCRAIDRITGTQDVQIKWVNDIYIGQKKLSGILCEMVSSQNERAVIVGVGVNFAVNKGLLPGDLRRKIGSLKDVTKAHLCKEQLCAYILNEVEDMYRSERTSDEFLALYRKRSAVLGREIQILKNGGAVRAAALEIDSDGGLIVRYAGGETDKLTAGEISIAIN